VRTAIALIRYVYVTENDRWGHHPDSPPSIGTRAAPRSSAPRRSLRSSPPITAARPSQLESNRLYTVAELA
jgi:hypothetical protein